MPVCPCGRCARGDLRAVDGKLTKISFFHYEPYAHATKFHQDFRGQGHKARRPGIRASATVRNRGS